MDLPSSWKRPTFKEVCLPTSQWNPSKEKRERFTYIDVSAVSRDSCTIEEAQAISAPEAPSRARKIVRTGDSLYATVRPTLRRIAFVDHEYDDQIASTAFCVLRPDKKEITPRFIYFLLQTDFINEEITKHESGASYPAVNDKHVLNCGVPLPPKPEQEKIAAVLWKVQKAVEVQDKLVRITRELKAAAMRRLFTHGLRNEPLKETEIGPVPECWGVHSLSEVAQLERGRFTHRPRNEPRFYGGTTPFVQTGDVVRSGGHIRSFTQTLNEEGVAISRVFPKGTILITIAANIGYAGVLDFDSACPDSLIGISPKPELDVWFLEYFLQTQQPDMDRLAPKGTQKNINIQFLSPWRILVPPLDEQREIAHILQTLDRKIGLHEKKRAALQDLFKTLLHQLMTAQIRVNALDIDISEVAGDAPARNDP